MYGRWLAHHGIQGMKWGVRRYQNKDGSLTPRGKKRYNQPDFSTKKGRLKSRKFIRDLSDEELNNRINRLRREQALNSLILERESINRSRFKDSMERVATRLIEDTTIGSVKYLGRAAIQGSFNRNDFANMVFTGQLGGVKKKK